MKKLKVRLKRTVPKPLPEPLELQELALREAVIAAARAWVEKRNHACEWAVIKAVDALVAFEEETE